jgi:hypothetical protein
MKVDKRENTRLLRPVFAFRQAEFQEVPSVDLLVLP